MVPTVGLAIGDMVVAMICMPVVLCVSPWLALYWWAAARGNMALGYDFLTLGLVCGAISISFYAICS
jgi:hypothetical protein